MKKTSIRILQILFGAYVSVCVLMYFFQESMIFFPEKLDRNYKFTFTQNHEEIFLPTEDGTSLHGLLFTADSSKGLIFYLHGNAGSLSTWGDVAKVYLEQNYDVFILDYRGFGKSEGDIGGQGELFQDVQLAYDAMKKKYAENKITVLGYSIGTGPAAHVASVNNPQRLILQAPYFSLTDMMREEYPFAPTFLLKYKFKTNEYIQTCKMPIVIFHGDKDEVIAYESSVRLKAFFKAGDTLITLRGQKHNGMSDNLAYRNEIARILK